MGTSSDSATIVGSLDTTVPADNGVDGKRTNGAAEIRQVKTALKTTFANVTGAVTATHTQLNYLTGKSLTGSDTNIVTGTAGTAGDLVVWDANGDAVDGPTPPSGTIVGTTDSQTLSNKTFSGNLATTTGNFRSDNDYGLTVKDSGGTYRTLLKLDTSNATVIGGTASASVVTIDAGAGASVRVDSSGNVGIGTSTPDCKLDVAGYSKLGDSANAPQIKTEFLTGSVGAVGTSTTVTTSVTLAQIISVNALVNDSGGGAVAPGWGGLYDYGLAVNNSGNVVLTIGGSSSAVASQNYRVFVVYKAA